MPTLKIKHTNVDPANHPYNVLQRLKNRLQQKYNALRNKHPEERRAFRKIDKEIVKVNGSAKRLSQKDIHASRGVVSTVCHEMKNAKLSTTLFNIVIGLIGTGIILVVNTACMVKIRNVVTKLYVNESKIRITYRKISSMIFMDMTEYEKLLCTSPSSTHLVCIKNKCTDIKYKEKMIRIVNDFYSIIQQRKKKIKNGDDTSLSDSQYKIIARLQRSQIPTKAEDNAELFTKIDEDIAEVLSGGLSFFLMAVFVAPITEELFKFCSLRLTDKSLVPTTTFAYCELLLYVYRFWERGTNIPLNVMQSLFRVMVAPFHIKTASKMKHAPVGQHYRTLRKQMIEHLKWNATSSISLIRLLINDFKKMYRGEAHTLKDTYQGVHLLLYGKTDKKIEAATRTHKRGKYLTRFRRTKRVQ